MHNWHKSSRLLWALFIISIITWFYVLGATTLVPPDEGRYAEMAREMLSRHDWITPRLNDIKYFEKPPLQTWMNVLTFTLFGLGEWQARLWTGLCGFFSILLTGYVGSRIFNRRIGFYAALVLGSSFLWSAMSHINTLDIGMATMMALTLCSLLVALHKHTTDREQRNWMLICWASMALAILSKGLIGIVLPGAVLVLYTIFARDIHIWKKIHLVKGLLLFFAIVTPWFVIVSIRNPEFAHFFFIHEHLQRFTTRIHHRTGAWYYFILILMAGIAPWLGVLLQGLKEGLRDHSTNSNANLPDKDSKYHFQPKKMLLIWTLFIFFFFSISDSKLPAYILPIFPALALLIACRLDQANTRTLYLIAIVFGLPAAIGLMFVHRIPASAKDPSLKILLQQYLPWIYIALTLMVVGAIVAIFLARRHKHSAIILLAFSAFMASQLLISKYDAQGRYAAGVNHLSAIQTQITPDTALYMVGRYEQSLPFYLQRTATLVAYQDEMAFGLNQEPHLAIPSITEFADKWEHNTAIGKKEIAILQPSMYPLLQKLGITMHVIGRDPLRIIVNNAAVPRNED